MRKLTVLMIIILSLGLFYSCGFGNDIRKYGVIYGTDYEIRLTGKNANRAYKDILNTIEDIESVLSVSIKTSDVYKVNNSEPNTPISVNDLTIEMYIASEYAYELTKGAFNVAIYPLVDLWGFSHSHEDATPPSREKIDALLPYCNLDYFKIDKDNKTITRLSDKAQLDFGGIAKGYAVQKAIDIAYSYQIDNAIINIGGNVGIIGDTIKVGIRSPRNNSLVFGSFYMEDGYSVATSGDYERFYLYEGSRYHHIIDPKTGAPTDNGIIGVSIVHNEGDLTDMFSTAIFVMGKDDGIRFATEHGIQCVIITSDQQYYTNMDMTLLEEGYSRVMDE